MLKIYDKDHNAIGYIVKYKDCKIESEVSTGDKTISFIYLAKHHALENEMYIRTKDDEYVIKEVPAQTGSFPQIVAVLNLEELQRDMWQTFSVTDTTIDAAVRPVLAGTGWTVGHCDVMKKRNAGMIQVSTLDVIQNLCTAFMCEPVFDTINKTISFYQQRGEDKGVYFLSGLNMEKLQKKSTSYDYYTRIIPIGQNGLNIESVNDGKNYLENFQYSNKVLTYIWKDESYTEAQALKEDAELKLNDLSKPEKSFQADVRDLANQKPEYGILSYGLGDIVTIIDKESGTRETQRIKKIVEYPKSPEKNTCEIANTILTFEELQRKYQAAADIINYTVTGDGRYTGTINVSDILNFDSGLAGSYIVGEIKGLITDIQGEISIIKLTLGELDVNYLSADEADIKYATIVQLDATKAIFESVQSDYASFKSTTTEELSSHTALIDELKSREITVEYLEANYAHTNLANIELGCITTAMLGTGIVETAQIADGSITDAKVVELTANKITAGILSVERLEIRGSENSIVYALNNIDGALQAQNVNTINGEVLTERTITADKIVANAITSNEIAAKTITANNIAAGTITSNEIAASSIKAFSIDVDDLFAQNITATGTITGVSLVGVDITAQSGNIAGFEINDHGLFSSVAKLYSSYSGQGRIELINKIGDYEFTACEFGLYVDHKTEDDFNNIYLGMTSENTARLFLITQGKSLGTNGVDISSEGKIFIGASDTSYINMTPDLFFTTGVIQVGTSLHLFSDSEGGNIRLTGGDGMLWGIKSPGNILKIYRNTTELYHLGADGFLTAYSGIKFNQGGGWYMSDATWNRAVNNKGIYTAGVVRGDNGLFVYGLGAYGQLQMAYENYGVILRNDSNSFYILLTDSGNPTGAWNSLRPFTINLSTGNVTINGSTFTTDRTMLRCGSYALDCLKTSSNNHAFRAATTSGGDCDNVVYLGASASRFHTAYVTNGVKTTSDERDKNIFELDDRYKNLIMKLKVISYTWKDDGKEIHVGISAQKTEDALISCGFNPDNFAALEHAFWDIPHSDGRTDRYAVNYSEIAMLMLPVVQSHESQIATIELWKDSVEYQLQEARERIEELQKEIALLKASA